MNVLLPIAMFLLGFSIGVVVEHRCSKPKEKAMQELLLKHGLAEWEVKTEEISRAFKLKEEPK